MCVCEIRAANVNICNKTLSLDRPSVVQFKVRTPNIMDLTLEEQPKNGIGCAGDTFNHCCLQCGRAYKHRHNLINHMRYECGQSPRFMCPYCGLYTKLKGNFKKHLEKQHLAQMLANGTTAVAVAESQSWRKNC